MRAFPSCAAELGGVWKHLSIVLLHASGFAPLCTSVEATAIALSFLLLPLNPRSRTPSSCPCDPGAFCACTLAHAWCDTLRFPRHWRSATRVGEGERQREVSLTIKNGLKVGKYNALSGNTHNGEYYTPSVRLAMCHGLASTSGLRERERERERGRGREGERARVCARNIEDARERTLKRVYEAEYGQSHYVRHRKYIATMTPQLHCFQVCTTPQLRRRNYDAATTTPQQHCFQVGKHLCVERVLCLPISHFLIVNKTSLSPPSPPLFDLCTLRSCPEPP